MALTGRQNEIVEFLKTRKYAKIDEIAKHIFVSDATVRRELTELKRLGLVERSHGGAVILENAEDLSIIVRQITKSDSKLLIAQLAESGLPEFKTVFIDNSSSALILAQRLNFRNKTVVTNGITLATQLAREPDTTVYLPGGRFSYSTGSLVGSSAVHEIEEMRFHLTICSCTSISERGVYESSVDQRDIKRAAIQNSRYKILLVDDTKFNDNAMHRTCELAEFDAIYTSASDKTLAPLRKLAGVRIYNTGTDTCP